MVSRAGTRAKETLGNQDSAGVTGARAGSKQHAPSFASECVCGDEGVFTGIEEPSCQAP